MLGWALHMWHYWHWYYRYLHEFQRGYLTCPKSPCRTGTQVQIWLPLFLRISASEPQGKCSSVLAGGRVLPMEGFGRLERHSNMALFCYGISFSLCFLRKILSSVCLREAFMQAKQIFCKNTEDTESVNLQSSVCACFHLPPWIPSLRYNAPDPWLQSDTLAPQHLKNLWQ